jgi:hypothetical protein
MSTIRKYWRGFKKGPLHQVPPVVCKDGFHMSVQASRTHYCYPKEDRPRGDYTAWEVGFPSRREELLMPYIEGDEDEATGTVYGRVPTEVVDAVIAKHGGLE